MDSVSPAPPAVPPSTRDGWRSIEHRVLKRRSKWARAHTRRRARFATPVRDAFEPWRRGAPTALLLPRASTVALALLAAADVVADNAPLRQASWVAAVLVAGL